mgnify:CR=1 FL=1
MKPLSLVITSKLTLAEAKLYEEINRMNERMTISAYFEDIPVDFEIEEEFTALIGNLCVGEILIRVHINLPNVKGVHNKWEKGAYIRAHKHTEACEYIWLTNGALKITLYNENGSVKSETVLRHFDMNQPFKIEAGVVHLVKAVQHNTNFIVRFEKKK